MSLYVATTRLLGLNFQTLLSLLMLGRSTHKNHLVRVRKTSWFSLKHLFWLPQKRPEVSTGLLTNIQWSDFGCRLVITMNNIKATVKSIESKFSECKMVYLIIFVSSSVI